MATRLPPLTALRAFDAAARRLNFARAAEDLAVTPGAVSRQIQALEETLGVPLFVRGNRSVELTARGRAYAREVRDAFDRLVLATEQVRGRDRHGPLSICAYPTFAMRWLMPRWRRFHDMHPGIDLQLTTSLAPVDMARDGFDATVRIGDGSWPGHGAVWLAPVEVFPVCSPLLAARLRQPADLRRHVLIHNDPRPDDWPRWLKAVGVSGIDAARGPRFETMSLAFQAAIEGVGVAMGVGCLVAEDLASGRLVRPLSFTHRSRREFHLVYPLSRQSDPRLAAFRAFLAAEAEMPAA
ncbi:transcriptional regulator GcvA [Vineibacter terrae]|uniref:Transcriptional regulator GcvA n=1 Tax=Vineibacter terrae TaxID=2586908 RepID=A0A5C8PWY2_9HYPH|nr:transcriptional regulator GcvA [Vineibacter terrae]TXL82379.1 transcriptional regulator GcvA [Vineibacter terrae]